MTTAHNKAPTLSAEKLAYIKQQIEQGQLQGAIAKTLGIRKSVVTAVSTCLHAGYPIADYQIIYGKSYARLPKNESGQFYEDIRTAGSWDVRKGLELLRVPFSQWSAAI